MILLSIFTIQDIQLEVGNHAVVGILDHLYFSIATRMGVAIGLKVRIMLLVVWCRQRCLLGLQHNDITVGNIGFDTRSPDTRSSITFSAYNLIHHQIWGNYAGQSDGFATHNDITSSLHDWTRSLHTTYNSGWKLNVDGVVIWGDNWSENQFADFPYGFATHNDITAMIGDYCKPGQLRNPVLSTTAFSCWGYNGYSGGYVEKGQVNSHDVGGFAFNDITSEIRVTSIGGGDHTRSTNGNAGFVETRGDRGSPSGDDLSGFV